MKQIIDTFTKYNPKSNANETHTRLRCEACGAETTPKGHPHTKKVKEALTAACKQCSDIPHPQHGKNWWSAFGLKKNPYVYGPMPWKRTSEFWRRVEARERGHLAWYWRDNHYTIKQN